MGTALILALGSVAFVMQNMRAAFDRHMTQECDLLVAAAASGRPPSPRTRCSGSVSAMAAEPGVDEILVCRGARW